MHFRLESKITKAYGEAKAGVVATTGYATIAFSIGIGMFLGDKLPDKYVLSGVGLIVLSGVLIAREKES